MPFVVKYKPRSLEEFVDQDKAVKQFLKWIKRWKPGSKALLFHGMPGTGKTALIEAYAAGNGMDLIQLNASDYRSAAQIKDVLGKSMQQRSLFKRGKIFMIDEVDGLCLNPTTFILSNPGIKLLNNISPGEGVISVNLRDLKLIDKKIEKIVSVPIEKALKIKTRHFSIKASLNHGFYVLNEKGKIVGKKAVELTTNDYVAVIKFSPHTGTSQLLRSIEQTKMGGAFQIKIPATTSPKFTQFIGFIVGDGSFKGFVLRFHSKDRDQIQLYKKYLLDLFGLKSKENKDKRKKLFYVEKHSSNLIRFLKANVPEILTISKDRSTPEIFFSTTLKELAAYLKGLFDAEGGVAHHSIEFYTTSQLLVHQIHMLLLKFRILSSIDDTKTTKKGNKVYRLEISGKRNIEFFSKNIGFSLERKNKKLNCLLQKLRKSSEWWWQYKLPISRKYIREIFGKSGGVTSNIKILDDRVKTITQQKLLKIILSLKRKTNDILKLEKLIQADITFEKIEKIETVAPKEKFIDISLSYPHTFVANGFVTHNSGREDRGGVGEIIKIVKASQFPVVLTANNPWNPKLRTLRSYCKLVQFGKISVLDVEKRLKHICEREKLKIDKTALRQLAKRANGDLRSAINDLEAVSQGKKRVTKQDLEVLGRREREVSIFDALKVIFKTQTALAAKLSIANVDKDPDEIFWWIENNIAREYEDPEEIAAAYDALSKADIFRQRVRSRQNWRFRAYMIDMMTAGVATAKKEMYRKFTRYQYPSKIIVLGRTKERRAAAKGALQKLSQGLHCSQAKVRKEFLPFIRIMLKNKDMRGSIASSLDLTKDELKILR